MRERDRGVDGGGWGGALKRDVLREREGVWGGRRETEGEREREEKRR